MQRILTVVVAALALLAPGVAAGQGSPPAEQRIALVIGNATYQAGALQTAANDAGLIAQTLQAAGFDVVGARDLDQDSLRRAFRDFLEKVQAAGPNTVAFVYASGHGVQLEGENYIVPVDARLARDTDIPVEAVRVSDYTRPLAALQLKASIVVLDAARPNSFASSGAPLAGGLALMEPEPGMLIAFNAAPGTVAANAQGDYGPYAQALAEMMREGGLPLTEVFDRVRLRVNDATKGAEVPWHASKVQSQFVFFERAPDAPPPAAAPDQMAALRSRPIRDLGERDAYTAALERDTLQGYQDFLAAYPDDPMAKRVRAIVAARREAITWRRSRAEDTPQAYWSYLRRYPRGPHAADCRRRLAFLSAEPEPPSSFAMMAYDVPPPPPEEIVYVERPVLVFDDPVYAFAPPPPPAVYYLPPPPPDFIVLAPPPPVALYVLPVPVYRPVPVWVRPPVYVAPPPNNVIFANVHNTVVIDNKTNTATVTNRAGQTSTVTPTAAPVALKGASAPPGAAAPAAARTSGAPTAAIAPATVAPALPPSVARKAAALPTQTPPSASQQSLSTQPRVQPGQTAPAQSLRQPLGRPLPGASGQPLPGAPVAAPGHRPGPPALPQTGAAPLTPTTGIAPSTGPAAAPPTNRPPSAALTPPSGGTRTTPPAPATNRPSVAPPVASRSSPAVPPAATRLPSSPPTAARPPTPTSPPVAARSSPPPAAVSRPPPPAVARPAPPPVAARTAPPSQAIARPPPPVAARPAPPPMAPRPSPPPMAARPAPPPVAMRAPPPRALAPQAVARPAPSRSPCGGPGQPRCSR